MEKWILKNPKLNTKILAEESGVSELLCRILANRQITDPDSVRRFVEDGENTFDGLLMKDMSKAVALIAEAIKSGVKIRIISDYDVDGVISAAILCDALKEVGAKVDFAIPNRVTDGYGLNENLVDAAINDEVNMIITCDNGIAAVTSIRKAKEAGMKVIITDHHEIPFEEDAESGNRQYILPPADAIVDCKQEDCRYPFKNLCGAGVVYKLVKCLLHELQAGEGSLSERASQINPNLYTELVSVATVCDVVDMLGENRAIIKAGLAKMQDTKNTGLQAMIRETKLTDKKLGTYHLGFILGPCVNASGRLEDARKAVELFLTKDIQKAQKIAGELTVLNTRRKQMTQDGIDEAVRQVQESISPRDKVIVVYSQNIHESIAGIVAGKVRERFNMPTIVLTDGEHEVKGSGRSIEEYNLFEEIQKCSEYLIRFGGHPMAAGLSLKKENIGKFTRKLGSVCTLTDEDIAVKVYIDLQLSLDAVNLAVAEELEKLEPYGKGNPKPLFGAKGVLIKSMSERGCNQNILGMKLMQKGGSKMLDAVYFGEYDIEKLKSYDAADIAFHIGINEYNGRRYVQITVQHIREYAI